MRTLKKQRGFFTALAPFVPSLISAGASLLGGSNRNSAQAHQADVANAFSERMASTQYQRGVSDLRAAGLNPILAATKGFSAGAPTGQQAQIQDVLTPAVSSGLDAYRTESKVQSEKQDRNIKKPIEEAARGITPAISQGADVIQKLPEIIGSAISSAMSAVTSPESFPLPAKMRELKESLTHPSKSVPESVKGFIAEKIFDKGERYKPKKPPKSLGDVWSARDALQYLTNRFGHNSAKSATLGTPSGTQGRSFSGKWE